jgi:uncharacterized protein YkwD
MRTAFCLAAMLGASVAVADDAVQGTAASGSQAGGSNGAATQSGTQTATAPQARPLHRHPVLFGMLVRNNNIRRRVGLFPHRMNPALVAAAQDHANYMARTGQFSHYTNGSPQSRANRFGFGGGVLENIATGGGVDTAFGMWQASGAHYASIVSNTTDAGFGYAIGPNGATYFVGIYGTGSPGAGETEDQISTILKEEEAAAKLAAEKTAAEKAAAEKTGAENDSQVKPASATVKNEQKPGS